MTDKPNFDFVNEYVVRVEHGHPGMISYNIIATPAALQKLISQLGTALVSATPDKKDIIKNEQGEVFLLSEYASESRGQTSRVYITFWKSDDLSVHHVHAKHGFNIWGSLQVLGVLVILGLAVIGFLALQSGFRP